MIAIEIADNQTTFPLDRSWYRALARTVCRAESVTEGRLSLVFVDNQTIHELNRTYLSHDYPTDVITFPLSEPGSALTGEIVLSTEYAAAQAVEYGWPAHVEAGLYVAHGILHLCGYDDHDEADAAVMKERQELLLKQFLDRPAAKKYAGQHGGASLPSG